MVCGGILGEIVDCCLGGDNDNYSCWIWTCYYCLGGDTYGYCCDKNEDSVFKLIREYELLYMLLLLGNVVLLFELVSEHSRDN